MAKNNADFISRMIAGVRNGSSLRPTVTPDMLSSLFIQQSKKIGRSSIFKDGDFGYDDMRNDTDNFTLEYPSLSTKSSPNSSNTRQVESYLEDLHSDQKYSKKQDSGEKNTLRKKMTKNSTTNNKHGKPIDFIPEEKNVPHISGSRKTRVDLIPDNEKSSTNNKDLNLVKHRESPIGQQIYLEEVNDFNTENIYKNVLKKIRNSDTLRQKTETSITINVGKITVRAVDDSRPSSYGSNIKDPRQYRKLSLSEYLKKRAEKT